MTNHTYGVNNQNGFVVVSDSLLKTKQFATKHGYKDIYVRYNGSHNITKVATKIICIWVTINNNIYSL